MHTLDVLEAHIIDYGFHPIYTNWIWHGEDAVHPTSSVQPSSSSATIDEMTDVLMNLVNESFANEENGNNSGDLVDYELTECEKLFDDLQAELWPGCTKMSALNFMVKLMQIKALNKRTNTSFDQLLEFLKISHPDGNKILDSHYDAKKKLWGLGLGYPSIHICKYDCAFFWKKNEDLLRCLICKTSLWVERTEKGKKRSAKVLRYFPLKNRHCGLYSSKHTAKDIQWHQRGRSTEDGVI